ncbi:MAG: hypothetical protein R3B09_29920, partial [Nannocystaceae bacterium]
PTPPSPTGRPVTADAAPTLADPPPSSPSAPANTPRSPDDAASGPASKIAKEPVEAAAPPASDDVVAPPRPTPQDQPCSVAAKLLAAGDQAMAAGDPMSAKQSYFDLIKTYPSCPEVPHAFLAFGDYYFAQAQLPEARQLYTKVTQFPGPALVAYATYKIAWCDLNEGNATAALDRFARVLSLTAQDPKAHTSLRAAALRDSVVAYADTGDPRKAAAFYRKIAGEEGMGAALDRLAKTYLDRGERDQAKIVCEGSPGACQ